MKVCTSAIALQDGLGAIGRSLDTLARTTPAPSRMPITTPLDTAEASANLGPLLKPRLPPVSAPATIAFHGSSVCRHSATTQSNADHSPPKAPKFPPVTGARALMDEMAPRMRSPRGVFLAPLTPCQNPPPIAPIANALPASLTIDHGLRVGRVTFTYRYQH